MAQIRLYRKFYTSTIIRTGNTIDQNYTLINPFFLSANTFVAGTGDTESSASIETSLTVTQQQLGIYYTDLNPNLYSSDVTYDLIWYVNYLAIAPLKKLSTRFRININKVTNQLEIEFVNNNALEFEILDGSLGIEIINNILDLENNSTNLEFGSGENLKIEIN